MCEQVHQHEHTKDPARTSDCGDCEIRQEALDSKGAKIGGTENETSAFLCAITGIWETFLQGSGPSTGQVSPRDWTQ